MNIIVNKEVSKTIVVDNSQPKVIVVYRGMDGSGGGSGHGDMLSTNNLSDVANVNQARNNIGAVSLSESIVNALIFG